MHEPSRAAAPGPPGHSMQTSLCANLLLQYPWLQGLKRGEPKPITQLRPATQTWSVAMFSSWTSMVLFDASKDFVGRPSVLHYTLSPQFPSITKTFAGSTRWTPRTRRRPTRR
eukprot:scaffold5345_cov306-Pinguiococcus_pyrenoidosus.AAC.2